MAETWQRPGVFRRRPCTVTRTAVPHKMGLTTMAGCLVVTLQAPPKSSRKAVESQNMPQCIAGHMRARLLRSSQQVLPYPYPPYPQTESPEVMLGPL